MRVTATSSGDSSASEIELDVREPNPYVTLSKDYVIDPGKTAEIRPLKENGEAKLELSSIPPLDLSRRLEYLVRYPHGCIEQITSGAFPQLYLPSVVECDANHAAGHRPQRQERAFAPGQLPALRRRIRLLERQHVGFGMGDGLCDALPDRGCEHGYGVDRAMLDRALKYLRGNPSDYYLTPGLYPVCAGAERDSDPGVP